ncbi:MAG: DUF2163 domain-containing protein [Parasphingorhabdus sp.]
MSLIWLDRDLTTTAFGWRLDRADGVSFGFTSHDQDIVVDNFRYRATPGMIPSTIALNDSLDVDSVEIEGVLNASAFTEEDLAAGRWNGARLQIVLLNWEFPNDEAKHLISGEFGEITRSGNSFQVEILGPTSFLDEAIVPLTSPTCRARFGDKQCKLSLHEYQHEVTLSMHDGSRMEFEDLAGLASNYAFGELRWLSGHSCGLSSAVLKGEGNAVWLADAPSDVGSTGERVLLTAGCDKNFKTCQNRFSNSLNFRGEPHLPGNDLLTRYPGA